MTAPHLVDPACFWVQRSLRRAPILMRSLLQSIIDALVSADAEAAVVVEYGRPTPSRPRSATATGQRDLDTWVGAIDLAFPKLRKGTYFPEWLLQRRKRAESALITVVADCHLAGVSTDGSAEKYQPALPSPSARHRDCEQDPTLA